MRVHQQILGSTNSQTRASKSRSGFSLKDEVYKYEVSDTKSA